MKRKLGRARRNQARSTGGFDRPQQAGPEGFCAAGLRKLSPTMSRTNRSFPVRFQERNFLPGFADRCRRGLVAMPISWSGKDGKLLWGTEVWSQGGKRLHKRLRNRALRRQGIETI
jgi:hypothetical protein